MSSGSMVEPASENKHCTPVAARVEISSTFTVLPLPKNQTLISSSFPPKERGESSFEDVKDNSLASVLFTHRTPCPHGLAIDLCAG